MNGGEFIRKVRRLGRRAGIAVQFDAEHSKGSHGRLYYGDRFTTVKDRRKEIGEGLYKAMCSQLGIDPKEL